MIWVDSISWALYTAIASDAAVVNSGTTVWLEREANTDANLTPWIGVYYGGTEIEPMRANVTQPFQARHTYRLECQAFDGIDLLSARLRAFQVLTQALAAVNSPRMATSRVLEGAVDALIGIQIAQTDPIPADDTGGMSIVEATLTFEQRA